MAARGEVTTPLIVDPAPNANSHACFFGFPEFPGKGGSKGGGGKSSSGGTTSRGAISLGGSTKRGASPFSAGGGKISSIPSGQVFSGRQIGGGTRSQVYGGSRYGSGYPYGGYGSYVGGRPFPFGFWPVYWGSVFATHLAPMWRLFSSTFSPDYYGGTEVGLRLFLASLPK